MSREGAELIGRAGTTYLEFGSNGVFSGHPALNEVRVYVEGVKPSKLWALADAIVVELPFVESATPGLAREGDHFVTLKVGSENGRGTCTGGEYFSAPRKTALYVLLNPRYTRRVIATAEIERENRVHVGTIVTIRLTDGDQFAPSDKLDELIGGDILDLSWTPWEITLAMAKPAVDDRPQKGVGPLTAILAVVAAKANAQPGDVTVNDKDQRAKLMGARFAYRPPTKD